ncbi:hypothetical protein DRO57_08725 [Candidatus Bathyarchaeota archaeon]|nr:MAG: hypothetical protein DRO57_08725 [Candidatus Bathyarchaeota archaeon]
MSEGEKQRMIWKAFGVDVSDELKTLEEMKTKILAQINSGILTEEVKQLIKQVVKDEVKRILLHRKAR